MVICTANICRSPAASVFLQEALLNKADQTIRKLMLERGFNLIESHRSQALMPHHLAQADLVLCMERDHLLRVQHMNPVLSGKAHLLGHFDDQAEVSDPIGKAQAVYDASLDQMQRLATTWAQKMQQMGFV
jgi:protein-tyrosine phosphatase